MTCRPILLSANTGTNFESASVSQMQATHRFPPQRQLDGHDTTHDPTGMPIPPGLGPFIVRADGQRMEVRSQEYHAGHFALLGNHAHMQSIKPAA